MGWDGMGWDGTEHATECWGNVETLATVLCAHPLLCSLTAVSEPASAQRRPSYGSYTEL